MSRQEVKECIEEIKNSTIPLPSQKKIINAFVGCIEIASGDLISRNDVLMILEKKLTDDEIQKVYEDMLQISSVCNSEEALRAIEIVRKLEEQNIMPDVIAQMKKE